MAILTRRRGERNYRMKNVPKEEHGAIGFGEMAARRYMDRITAGRDPREEA